MPSTSGRCAVHATRTRHLAPPPTAQSAAREHDEIGRFFSGLRRPDPSWVLRDQRLVLSVRLCELCAFVVFLSDSGLSPSDRVAIDL